MEAILVDLFCMREKIQKDIKKLAVCIENFRYAIGIPLAHRAKSIIFCVHVKRDYRHIVFLSLVQTFQQPVRDAGTITSYCGRKEEL